MSQEELSLREELTSAFDEDENLDGESSNEDIGADEDSGASGVDLQNSEENLESVEEPETENPDDGDGSGEPRGDGNDQSSRGDDAADKSGPKVEGQEVKPPIDYGPEAREAWKDVPQVVKQQIRDRELQIAQAMQNTKAARNTYDQLNTLAQSYAPIMAAEGAQDAMQAVQGLFQTVAELRMGTPEQRASKMASLINHYGIDIEMLDNALVGTEGVQPQSQNASMQKMIQDAVAPLYQQQQQAQNYQQQQVQQSVNNELVEFAKDAEFLNDVRHTMADLIEVASRQGHKLSFKDAYDKACALHPQVSAVMAQRAEQARIAAASQKTATKRNASSSLGARSVPGAGARSPDTLRAQLEELWDNPGL